MELNEILKNAQEHMKKSFDFSKAQIEKIRTGGASSTLVDGIEVLAYGTNTPLNQVAGISTPDARTIVIQPYDTSLLGDIERAILTADLGFNPQNDGNVLRIPVPPLTEERRLEYVKVCRNYAEEGRVAIRNSRRSAIEAIRSAEKEKEISEDQQKDGESDVQTLTDKYIAMVDEVLAKKEKELIGKD
ncbi:MAG: ribosome recycling factor [Candidatus Kapaibacterium sp.]|nr:ribosome recycling factor [Ignavibacteriota bacterium]MCB9220226.1 ribosome recycling factor [Ignavibacteria bacterium]